ncbi:hypothetical protein AB0L74_24245 [Streptomyces sp. NPDC052020]|uniref:hypothetical protein n=1 Tax=Streptomyces sp. NPDC052020 TaxID=3155677 RepID=UPI00342FFF77
MVQRAVTGPATAAGAAPPARPPSASPSPASGTPVSAASAGTSAPGTARRAGTSPDPGPDRGDLDDLARRLLDPVSRLLRAELRRDRERMGRPHDRRR